MKKLGLRLWLRMRNGDDWLIVPYYDQENAPSYKEEMQLQMLFDPSHREERAESTYYADEDEGALTIIIEGLFNASYGEEAKVFLNDEELIGLDRLVLNREDISSYRCTNPNHD